MTVAGPARPARWDVPFGARMTDENVEAVLRHAPFSRIDADAFPDRLSLRGILKNDSRLRSYEPGDIVVRQGDYGNSAFFVMRGSVRVVLAGEANDLPASYLGRSESHRKGLLEALAQLWSRPQVAEARHRVTTVGEGVAQRTTAGDETLIFLQDVPGLLARHRTAVIEAGSFFGEIAALGRSPRTATIFADGPCTLLEIRWQGLRDIRRRAPEIKQHIDELYREHSLRVQLRSTPLFAHLAPEDLVRLADQTTFETHGDFDWHTSYKSLAEKAAAMQSEPVIAREGDYPNGIVIIRAGFARLSQRHHNGERTVAYLGKGQIFGLEEIVDNWRGGAVAPLRHSLRAVGYVDTLVMPSSVMESLVLPRAPASVLPPRLDPSTGMPPARAQPALPQGLLEFLAENRYVNGTATMMLDLERCVRCDDCVTACAAAHDNNPRFVRHGLRHGSHMVANACMHCVDPVCMIGCPTGAIHRSREGGQVLINDQTCIGCGTCATSCPYDNIRMVGVRDAQGALMFDKARQPIFKATKCDLCAEQPVGPACELACPHDALRRVDMQDLSRVASWVRRT